MKRIATLTTAVLALLSSVALADHYETLADYRDSVTLAKGEAALVLFVTETPTVQYQKEGRRPVQFRLGLTRQTEARNRYVRYGSSYPAQVDRNPSSSQPLALAGPAKISLMSDGLVSLQIVSNRKGK